jgi:hypothetical protein
MPRSCRLGMQLVRDFDVVVGVDLNFACITLEVY